MEKVVKMEEKTSSQKNEGKVEKLSYEQLEAYAQQTIMKAKQVMAENQQLKEVLQKLQYEGNLKEVELALKCLDHAEKFSPKFIKSIVERLEEILDPNRVEEVKKTS